MTRSMSRRGNNWERADRELVQQLQERAYAWNSYTFHAKMKASLEYIEAIYNRKPHHSALDYQSPKQLLVAWLSRQNQENW